jgi:hypothetical protein
VFTVTVGFAPSVSLDVNVNVTAVPSFAKFGFATMLENDGAVLSTVSAVVLFVVPLFPAKSVPWIEIVAAPSLSLA